MYVLTYSGPVPAYAWYRDMASGVKARTKARSKGYHVVLNYQPIGEKDAEADKLARDNHKRKRTFADRLRAKFRRKNRGVL